MPGIFGRPTRVCSVRSDGRPVISGHVRESSLHQTHIPACSNAHLLLHMLRFLRG